MAIKQSIWSLDQKEKLPHCTTHTEAEIEALVFGHIEMLDPEWLVIGQQIVTDFGGRIDLLCMDVNGDIIIVELKRGLTPREVTAQAIDYAAWVSSLPPSRVATIYEEKNNGETIDKAYYEKFKQDLDNDSINTNTKMVIVATQMDNSTERIIRYLNGFDLDINVLFFQVFEHKNERLVCRAWMIEESEAQIIKARALSSKVPWNGEFYHSFGADDERKWEDARHYGFISAGGGTWYSSALYNLEPGNRVWVNIPRTGYVGVGEVIEAAKLCSEAVFEENGQMIPFYSLNDLKGNYLEKAEGDKAEHLVKVRWQHTESVENAMGENGIFGNQNIICKPINSKWINTIEKLKNLWNVE